jgi:hypothetical protein
MHNIIEDFDIAKFFSVRCLGKWHLKGGQHIKIRMDTPTNTVQMTHLFFPLTTAIDLNDQFTGSTRHKGCSSEALTNSQSRHLNGGYSGGVALAQALAIVLDYEHGVCAWWWDSK